MSGCAWKSLAGNKEEDGRKQLLADIRAVCRQMEAARARFELEEDPLLIEASIYELESLKARYSYLIKLAKRQKIADAPIAAIYGAQKPQEAGV